MQVADETKNIFPEKKSERIIRLGSRAAWVNKKSGKRSFARGFLL
jgi:hypothetical protein